MATVGLAALATLFNIFGALDWAVLSVSCEAKTRGIILDGPRLLMGA